MLVAASGYIHEQVSLITLGHTCRYLVNNGGSGVLFDLGLTAHIDPLLKRLETAGVSTIDKVVITHLHADRIGGAALLRRRYGRVRLVGSPSMRERLQDSQFVRHIYDEDRRLSQLFAHVGNESLLSFDEFMEFLQIDLVVKDSDLMPLTAENEARVFSCPGHTAESMAYLLLPSHYLITDEGFGYYRGRDPAAPGADESLVQAAASIKRFDEHEILGLCLPYIGTLTGTLVGRHLSQLLSNMNDLRNACEKAAREGFDSGYIKDTIRAAFYSSESLDPVLMQALAASLAAVWRQIDPYNDTHQLSLT